MKAVVMAGGFGTRIQPLTNSLPKPMLPIVNKPMMEHIIKKLKAIGIEEFVVLLYFKPDVIRDYFKDGKRLGVKIRYVLPDDDYGTAGAVKCAEEYLKDESFIIVSGDLVTDFDFNEIVAFHNKKKSKLTITLTSVKNPLEFGVVIANPDDKIEKFLEKPSWGEVFSDTINTGIYILEPEILSHIPKDDNYDFAKDLFPSLMKEGVDLWGCSVKGYWRDVGNPYSYRDVYADILNEKVEFQLKNKKLSHENALLFARDDIDFEAIEITGKVVLGKNVKIGKGVQLHNVVIGDDVTIGNNVRLSDSVVWNNVQIKSGAQLNRAVICDNNIIGRKVKAKHGVIIAENCTIDDLTSFENDVVVWPSKIIDEGSIVSNNIVWGTKYKNSLFEYGMVTGRTNLELSCEMAAKLAESFGAILPAGSTVLVSRDYHKSSRMIKRVFLGGLLASGINVIDLRMSPSSAMRFDLTRQSDVVAGVHIEQSIDIQTNTNITFYTDEGLNIDAGTEKNIEKNFFRESFRRVNSTEIGEIIEDHHYGKDYINAVIEHLDVSAIKNGERRVGVDLLFGTMSAVYPEILNELEIDAVTLNAYLNDKKLTKIPNILEKTKIELSNIVTGIGLDLGFVVYPNAKGFDIVCENGKVMAPYVALHLILDLINAEGIERRILLPAWAPDYMDERFGNLVIERGKISGRKANELAKYYFVGTPNRGYAFTEFTLHFDAVYSSLKVIEMLSRQEKQVGASIAEYPEFYYLETKIPCDSEHKGKMMRKFLEDSKGKEASHLDGVKIWVGQKEWVLMIPEQNSDFLRLYIQADNQKSGEKILKEYTGKIEAWIKE